MLPIQSPWASRETIEAAQRWALHAEAQTKPDIRRLAKDAQQEAILLGPDARYRPGSATHALYKLAKPFGPPRPRFPGLRRSPTPNPSPQGEGELVVPDITPNRWPSGPSATPPNGEGDGDPISTSNAPHAHPAEGAAR